MRCAALVCATSLALAGCEEGTQRFPGVEEGVAQSEVRVALDNFYTALTRGHGPEACASMTSRARKELVVSARNDFGRNATSCASAVRVIGRFYSRETEVQIGRIRVSTTGERASARIERDETAQLVLGSDGQWLVDVLS